jgi:hypothetical protein
MKYPILPAVALSILVVNLQAQQPGTSPQKSAASAHSTRVLTGCLRAGPAPDTFMLTNATPRVDPNDLAGPAVGTSGEKVEYDLTAETGLDRSGPPVDLKAHVGQQVEVTVRPAEIAVVPPATSATSSSKETAAEAKPVERKPARVAVTALKSLSSSCS